MTIKVTYNVTDVYMSQSVSPVYINVSYSDGSSSGGGVWGTITGTLSNQTDLQNALNAKVPYSGATGDVSLGEYGINVGNVIYDTTPTGIPTEQGATYWDTDAETVALIMNGTIQKVGEDTFYHVRNTTGSTIAKGTAVRFSGTTGNSGRLLIAPMLADGTYPSQYYMGITSEELVNNADGKVYHFGKMRNINTSAFADGDVLYVSPSVAGALTATAPVAPNNIIVAAAVVHAANNGTLMIRTTLGSNINADEGVLLTTPTANQGLFYDSGLWVNKSITSALGYTPANAATTLTINGVTYDLSTSRSWTIAAGISGSGASGQVTYWTGASAVSGSNNLFWDNTNGRLGIGTNAPAARLSVTNTVASEYIATFRASGTPNPAINIEDGDITIPNYSSVGFNPAPTSNTIGTITPFTAAGGGLTFAGYTNANDERALFFSGISGKTNATTNAVVTFRAGKTDGSTNITTLSANDIAFQYNNWTSPLVRIMGSGNFIINNTTDSTAHKFQVYGDTLLRGSGATNATTALTVQNSSSDSLLTMRNDGVMFLGNTNASGLKLQIAGSFTTRFRILTSTSLDGVSGTILNSAIDFTNNNLILASKASSTTSNVYIIPSSFTSLSGSVLINTTTDVASSICTLDSTTKGFLPPRMTTTQKNAIATPAAGLVVYDTTLNKLCVYTTAWETITSI